MTPARRESLRDKIDLFAEREGYCLGSDILYREDVVKLISREHRAIVRLVKQQRDKLNPTIAVENWGKGYIEACDDLLAALTRRQKGTR